MEMSATLHHRGDGRLMAAVQRQLNEGECWNTHTHTHTHYVTAASANLRSCMFNVSRFGGFSAFKSRGSFHP